MITRLLGRSARSRRARRAVTDAVYGKIVAAARQPVPYSAWNVPDTPLGRFEMISLHVFLFLHRMRGEGGPAADLAQAVTDEFFLDVEHSLRELGIGDLGVPKRMKKLARMFYGRANAYGEAIDSGDRQALAAALKRNIVPDLEEWPAARHLSAYVFSAYEALKNASSESILQGELPFPLPQDEEGP